MLFKSPPLKATILKRYKRFLADITLPNGETVVAHVPNTGSMKNCWDPGWPCMVTKNDDPKRKLKYTLELTHNGKTWIGVNTSLTNKLAQEALENGVIKELKSFDHLKAEVTYGDSRLDFCLDQGNTKTFIEVKNVTLTIGDDYLFPDAVTTRGQKHLKELTKIAKTKDMKAVMLFIIQRQDAKIFRPAAQIDPEYAKLLKKAEKAGVLILAYECKMTESEVLVHKKTEVSLE